LGCRLPPFRENVVAHCSVHGSKCPWRSFRPRGPCETAFPRNIRHDVILQTNGIIDILAASLHHTQTHTNYDIRLQISFPLSYGQMKWNISEHILYRSKALTLYVEGKCYISVGFLTILNLFIVFLSPFRNRMLHYFSEATAAFSQMLSNSRLTIVLPPHYKALVTESVVKWSHFAKKQNQGMYVPFLKNLVKETKMYSRLRCTYLSDELQRQLWSFILWSLQIHNWKRALFFTMCKGQNTLTASKLQATNPNDQISPWEVNKFSST